MSDEVKVITLSFAGDEVQKCEPSNVDESLKEPQSYATRVGFHDDSPSLVRAKGLVKKYGKLTALNYVDLSIKSEKIIGLLGPNGSGKTTLIKILAGLLTNNSGEVTIDGKKIGEETKAIVSYLPERPYFNSWMSVKECLDFFEDFYADFDREIAEKMLADLDINPKCKLRTLSKGTKEKVQLILVMSRRAKLYLLDEPIAGVDPAARDYILDTIISKYNKGASVIISTHLISDIENVLDEYIFIKYGEVIEHGSVKDFKAVTGQTLDSHFREVFKYVP
ncbi:MAG: ABC transporter ATP-binding protein [Clostridia bacterium]|nr:ABC transporter ATP-binding protein [Clostridia bacterium]